MRFTFRYLPLFLGMLLLTGCNIGTKPVKDSANQSKNAVSLDSFATARQPAAVAFPKRPSQTFFTK